MVNEGGNFFVNNNSNNNPQHENDLNFQFAMNEVQVQDLNDEGVIRWEDKFCDNIVADEVGQGW